MAEIALASILVDLEARKTQVRLETNAESVTEYADAMKRGAVFPPVRLVAAKTKGRYLIADGWHRVLAAKEAKRKTIDAHVLPTLAGLTPLESAFRYALRSNVDHGLRLSPGDQRHKVRRALAECPEIATLSDRKAARELEVSHQTVSRARNELVAEGLLPHPDTGLVADPYLPNEYVPRSAFREAFGRTPETYLETRDYLTQLKAVNPKAWRWDDETRRVIHEGLMPNVAAAFHTEGNPIVDGLPRDWEALEAPDEASPREPFTDADRQRIERMQARQKFDAARKRIEAYGRADLTAAARTLAKYRSVPGLFDDLRDLVIYGGPPQEQPPDEF